MNCAQVKETLIDFLYGELSAEMRSAFVEHLDTCPSCKTEVAGYERTLDSTRAALGGPLLAEAPARVHLAVLEAAKSAAKQSGAGKQSAAAKPNTATRTRRTAPSDDLGFFARLWRTPWFLPAFGAASIATAVFLVRVLKNPEVLPGQHPHAVDERSLALPESAAAPEPAIAARPSAGTPAAKLKASAGPVGLDGLKLGEGQSGAGTTRRFAEPPPPRRRVKKASHEVDDLLGGFKKAESLNRGAQPLAAPEGHVERQAETAASMARKMPENEPAAETARPTARVPARSSAKAAGAGAPAPAYAPAPAPAYVPAPAATQTPATAAAKARRDDALHAVASAPPPSAPPEVRHKANTQSVQADEEAEPPTEATMDLAKDTKAKGEDKSGPSLEESIHKAERLFTNQDWNAAAAAYRDLLKRFPSHRDAPRWRERMNEANAAYRRTLEAKRKKAFSDDPLSGSKK